MWNLTKYYYISLTKNQMNSRNKKDFPSFDSRNKKIVFPKSNYLKCLKFTASSRPRLMYLLLVIALSDFHKI